jgi:uncharacterized protein YbjT (DUF2867 family)
MELSLSTMFRLTVRHFTDGMENNAHRQKTTLVLGGTGKTGRRVAERLTAAGLRPRIGSRSSEPPFDWEDRATWALALKDVDAVYLAYQPDLAFPGAVTAVRSFTALAVESGVRQLVLLSGRGEEEAGINEQTVRDSGADWTILRSSWFCQNFSEDYLLESVLGGEVALPVGDVPEPFVDVEDVADVAVAALTEDGHAGRVYELTGARLVTFADAVAEIAQASGRPVRLTLVPTDAYVSAMAEQGVPDDVVSLLQYLFGEVLDGRNAHLTDGVQQALGREPRDFADYARNAAATGVWA